MEKRISVSGGESQGRRPERATWTESETYEREDGTRYTRTREVQRWGGVYSMGSWSTVGTDRA